MAHSGGIGTCIRQIATRLNRPPFRVILLVHQTGEEWCKEIEQIAFHAPIYSSQEQLLFPFKIPRCDLFWSPHYNIPLLPIRAKKRVVTIHDLCHLTPYCHASRFQKAAAHFLIKKALRLSHYVTTVSQFSKSEIHRFFGNSKITVIYNGVDQNRFKPEKLEITLPKKYVLFMGNDKPHKNRSGILQAFSDSTFKGIELIQGNDRIPDEWLPTLYSSAECLVFPSFYEGFGLPPLEAMSCGCPTIVSSAACMPEICGDASLYIDPNNVSKIRDTLLNFLSNQTMKQKLITKGFTRVQNYCWDISSVSYAKLFQKVITLNM